MNEKLLVEKITKSRQFSSKFYNGIIAIGGMNK